MTTSYAVSELVNRAFRQYGGRGDCGARVMRNMGETISLTLPIPPSSNRYWRTVAYFCKKTGKPKAATFVSDEAKEYKRSVGLLTKIDHPIVSQVAITLRVFRERRTGDLDNKIKVLLDALQGVAFVDDNQVVELHALRYEDKHNPRVEIEITPLGLC